MGKTGMGEKERLGGVKDGTPEGLTDFMALMALQEDEGVCLGWVYCHDLVEAALLENLEDVIGQGTEGESHVAV